jgi:hypothetical protein
MSIAKRTTALFVRIPSSALIAMFLSSALLSAAGAATRASARHSGSVGQFKRTAANDAR